MNDELDLEALSEGAVVFMESDYGKYLYGRIRALHLSKHEEAEAGTGDPLQLMHEAHALREVINMIDEDVTLHTSKYFEQARQKEAQETQEP
jgi:hypothetical protein